MAEVTTPVPLGELDVRRIAEIGETFEALYERIYGKGAGFSDAGIQLITYRMRAIGTLPIRPELPPMEMGSAHPEPSSQRTGRQLATLSGLVS